MQQLTYLFMLTCMSDYSNQCACVFMISFGRLINGQENGTGNADDIEPLIIRKLILRKRSLDSG